MNKIYLLCLYKFIYILYLYCINKNINEYPTFYFIKFYKVYNNISKLYDIKSKDYEFNFVLHTKFQIDL